MLSLNSFGDLLTVLHAHTHTHTHTLVAIHCYGDLGVDNASRRCWRGRRRRRRRGIVNACLVYALFTLAFFTHYIPPHAIGVSVAEIKLTNSQADNPDIGTTLYNINLYVTPTPQSRLGHGGGDCLPQSRLGHGGGDIHCSPQSRLGHEEGDNTHFLRRNFIFSSIM